MSSVNVKSTYEKNINDHAVSTDLLIMYYESTDNFRRNVIFKLVVKLEAT
jgi:hypothetical protein